MSTHINRLRCAISNTPGTTGALTVSTADAGFRGFGASQDGQSFDCIMTDDNAWEVRTSCVYTHSGTSLSRGTLEDSSTGSAIDLTSATKVAVTMSASMGNALNRAMDTVIPGGRLTLESGVPVSTTDQTAKTTIYYTPYAHTTIPLWNGMAWELVTFAETSLALGTMTSGKPYDVFGYLNGGVLALEKLEWTNDLTRATAVTIQDGRYCKSGDKSRLLLGTFYSTSTTTTESTEAQRYLCNMYNLRFHKLTKALTDAGHTYMGSYRPYNNSTDYQLRFVTAMAAVYSVAGGAVIYTTAGNCVANIAFVLDAITTPAAQTSSAVSVATTVKIRTSAISFFEAPTGKHYLQLLERGDGTDVSYFSYPFFTGAVEC